MFLHTFNQNATEAIMIAGYLDHTLLAPGATESDIRKLCREGLEYHFKSICVSGAWVELCASLLAGSDVLVAAVVGFPHGNSETASKCFEAETYFTNGARELDVVMNVGWMLSGKTTEVRRELDRIREAAPRAILKLILETCYLSEAQKRLGCRLALEAGWDYVKTSTGFGTAGATLQDVRLMKSEVGNAMGIKASGGIREYETAVKYLQSGATRIGTSSGPEIVKGEVSAGS
ncbi:deoxyribose-phosphate aldolase [Robiginitalea aurantiaca]|uniref:Deoxyribose-phosphate aldolase n=1 Tax=Robiginitalea aurantiaca TaxID=3056915 RepID=A0ABT7WH85_9FLAO|nr:deoxyribose-phosphate aldolase [Robiginitalea aurantiaca]MDM9632271.1 deoxyribose-phosphate aldolase [Robiginitalea aurantiaca]